MNTDNEINDAEALKALALRAQGGDQAALLDLLQEFRAVAQVIGHKMGGSSFGVEDVASLCMETFIRTLPEYDPTKGGLRGFWRAKAINAVVDHYRATSPVGRHSREADAYRAEVHYARERKGHSFINLHDFAARHDIPMSLARRVAIAGGGSVPMDAHVAGIDGETVGSLIPCDEPSPADVVERMSMLDAVREALSLLSPLQRMVVERRFGLTGDAPEPFPETAVRAGVSQQRVHQILSESLQALKRDIARESANSRRCRPNMKAPKRSRRRRQEPVAA